MFGPGISGLMGEAALVRHILIDREEAMRQSVALMSSTRPRRLRRSAWS